MQMAYAGSPLLQKHSVCTVCAQQAAAAVGSSRQQLELVTYAACVVMRVHLTPCIARARQEVDVKTVNCRPGGKHTPSWHDVSNPPSRVLQALRTRMTL
jgi:hypothetical protein